MLVASVRWTGSELSVLCLLTITVPTVLGSVQSYPQNTDCVSGKGKGCLGTVCFQDCMCCMGSMLTFISTLQIFFVYRLEDGGSRVASGDIHDEDSVGMQNPQKRFQ